MANEFKQVPAILNVTIVKGDEVSIAVDVDPTDLTGYSIEAPIYVKGVFASGVGGVSAVETIGEIATNFAISFTNQSQGQLILGLSELQTNALSTSVDYRWYLRWVAPGLITRTILAGTFDVINP
tara:strand:- start:1405 stop:1779 length:375 start_codon:yes stop_codon:yes gene_type:complete